MNSTTFMPKVALMFLAFLMLGSACSPSTSSTSTTNPPPGGIPFWDETEYSKKQIEAFYLANPPSEESSVIIRQRPSYYDGSMPLQLLSAKQLSPGFPSSFITIDYESDAWKTFFIYKDQSLTASGIATGARTFDKFGKLLAESRFEQLVAGIGIVILEVHYNIDGSVRFWCMSQVDFYGYKTGESDVHGTKEKDYYFIWASSTYSP